MNARTTIILIRACRSIADALEAEMQEAEQPPAPRRPPPALRLPARPDAPPTDIERAAARRVLRRKGVA